MLKNTLFKTHGMVRRNLTLSFMENVRFSGHETFQCRNLWLKKGYDFLIENEDISDNNAVVELGVGKNMYTSMKFWLKAYGVVDSDYKPTELGQKLFDTQSGYDPYLEDPASLWLLHYNLIEIGEASIYKLVFHDYRKIGDRFTQKQLFDFIQSYLKKEDKPEIAEKTLKNDIRVFLKTYIPPIRAKGNIEDGYSSLLLDLNLIRSVETPFGEEENYYVFNVGDHKTLASNLILYFILDKYPNSNSISFKELTRNFDSLSETLLMDRSSFRNRILELAERNSYITFKSDAGIEEIQFKMKHDKEKVLGGVYE